MANHNAAKAKAVANSRAAKAKAAVAALSYSDDRRKFPPVVEAARALTIIPQGPHRTGSVARNATSRGNLSPRREPSTSASREPSRGAREELVFHPNNPRFEVSS